MQEEGRRIAGEATTLGGRVDHAVRRRRQDVVGQALQHVADIDHQGARGRGDVQPLAIGVLQLQTSLFGAQQQGDDVDVLMGAGAHAGGVGRDRRIVQHPQDAVAQFDLVLEIVVAQLHVAGDGLEDLAAQLIQGVEHAVEVGLEALDLGRPDVVAHVLAIGMARGQFAPDVPELLEVHGGGALGGFDAEGGQAARAAGAGLVILAFHILGQGEEGLGVGDGGVDGRLVQAVVGDDGEAVAREGGAQGVGEGLEVGVIGLHRHGDDGAGLGLVLGGGRGQGRRGQR
ncbi:hypothetical protein D3C80_735940 [compost metagenome]